MGTNTSFKSTTSMGKVRETVFTCNTSLFLYWAILAALNFCLAKTMTLLMLISFRTECFRHLVGFPMMQHYIFTLTHMHWQYQLMQLVILTLSFLFDSTFFSRQCSWDGLGCKHQRQRQVKMQFAQTMHKMQVKL